MTPRSKWNAQQIRKARRIALRPLLEQMGYCMQELKNDNWKVYGKRRFDRPLCRLSGR